MITDYKITPKQQEVLRFIIDHKTRHDKAPTLQQITDQFGLYDRHAAAQYLRSLSGKGYIKRQGYRKVAVLKGPEEL